jgi:hypothetical protein
MSTLDPLRLFHGPRYDLPSGPLQTYHDSAAERCEIVRKATDVDALKDALDLVQTTVRVAIQRRIRKLETAA